ncbi:MAG: hypothetical protein AB8F95_22300 [Bacteroidia bacterium]
MAHISEKETLQSTYSNVRSFSFQEKRNELLDEERINFFLDAINAFKSSLDSKTNKINKLNESLEKLTWLNDLDEECLLLMNDLISSARDLKSSLIRQYVSMEILRKKGIAKEEIKLFKASIDDLQESYEDLESVFFFLPEFRDFEETTQKLSLV